MVSPERKSESNIISWRYENLPAIVNLTVCSCDIEEDGSSLDEDRNETDGCSLQATFGTVEWEGMEDDNRDAVGNETMVNGFYARMDCNDDNLDVASIWKNVRVDEIAFQEERNHPRCKSTGKKGNRDLHYPMIATLDNYLHLPLSNDEEAPTSEGLPSNGDTFGLWLPCREIKVGSYEKEDDDVSLLYDDPDIDDLDCLPQSTVDVLHFCLDDWADDVAIDSEVGEEEIAEATKKKAKKLLKKTKREEKKNRKKNWIHNYGAAPITLLERPGTCQNQR